MIRDTILLFTSMKEPVSALSDEDAGKLLKAILAYQTGEPVNLEGLLNAVFISIRQQIDYNNQAYEDRVALRSEAGKKGAEARWQKMAKDGKRISANGKDNKRISANGKNALYVNDNDNDLTNECITAWGRAQRESDDENPDEDWDLRHHEDCIRDDDVITTTDGRVIKLKDLKFGTAIKVGYGNGKQG